MNKYLIVAFATLVMAQLIKFAVESYENNKLRWGRLFNGAGGMPSSHTSFTFSLAFMIGFQEGFNTALFAIALVFSFVVAYDAMGLRMESGKQATLINRIANEMFTSQFGEGVKKLKQELGHNPLEVLMGIIFGFISSLVFTMFIF